MNIKQLGLDRLFKNLLTLALALQISLGQSAYAIAADQNNNGHSVAKNLTDATQDPATREHMRKWEQAASAIEKGDLRSLPDYDPDPVGLANQYVEINGRIYSFNEFQVEVPPVSFTALRVIYNEETRQLVFEGMRGQNDRGENGVVVGRHVLSNIDIAGMAKDDELLSIVDSKGNLHVFPMDYVATNVFKSPLPLFKKLWSPAGEIAADKFELRYASPGLRPPNFNDPNIQAVLPRDAEGHVQINSGDLFVYAVKGNERELVGVFSRKVTYEKIVRGFKYLIAMLIQIYPANVDQSIAKKLIADIEAGNTPTAESAEMQAMPEPVRRALLHFSNVQIQNSQASIDQQNRRANRQFHRLNESDWQKTFAEIERVAKDRSNQLAQREDENAKYEKQSLDLLLDAGDLTPIWKSLYSQSSLMPQAKKQMADTKPQREWLRKATSVSLKYLSPIFAVGAIWGFPYMYEQTEAMQQIQVLSWMYQNAIPDVVKDLEYRKVLLASTVSLLAIWPASVSISWSMGRALKVTAAALSRSTSKWAGQIRDIARQWAPLSNWQRITSFGMRFYGLLIYPLLQAPLKLFDQTSMITALANGLNPFQKVDPQSALGQKIGAQNSFRIGTLNPFASRNEKDDKLQLQLKAQSILAERKKRIENLSWIIAAVVVAEKEKVDPATINMVASGSLDYKKLQSIFSDKNLRRDWEATQETVLTYLSGLGDGYFDLDIKELNSQTLEKHFAIARDIVARIKAQDPTRKTISQLWRSSRNTMAKVGSNLLNLGMSDSKFLRSVYTNKFVSEQTERSFVNDHIMVALIYALIGERADLKHPEHLAAAANGLLWTSGPHWADVSMNTYAHFFAAGSKRALVFQQVKPKDSDTYEPVEYLWADVLDRKESFARTTWEWVANVIDPRKSDISHYAVKAFVKRLTTIQAAFFMQMATRMGLGHQNFGEAVLGWLIFFFAAQWYYGWPWDFIDRGTHLEGERIEEMRKQFQHATASIAQGLRDPNKSEGQLKIRDGYTRLVQLFEAHNPQAFKALSKTLSKVGYAQLIQEFNQSVNETSMQGLGHMVRLQAAIRSGRESEIQRAEEAMREYLRTNGKMTEEVTRMNAQALLDYSLENSPIYTQPHAAPSWVANAGLGAVLTTILAIPLSVASFDKDFLTVGNLGFWVAASLGGYWVYHKTLSKNGLVAQALNKIDQWKAARKARCEDKLRRKK